MVSSTVKVKLLTPHEKQAQFINSKALRIMIKAGRRGGKTTGLAIRACRKFLDGRRVLYACPTQRQTFRFWTEVKRMLSPMEDAGLITSNESRKEIKMAYDSEAAIRASTAFNANTLRGDYADELIFDEFQEMAEDAWEEVGSPMLIDNNGVATFLYTPPSIRSRTKSNAKDPFYAPKMWNSNRENPDWAFFHFTSFDNPFLDEKGLAMAKNEMTAIAYRQEILAEDIDDNPFALWRRDDIHHIPQMYPGVEMDRIVVGVDPSGTKTGDAVGIIVVGALDDNYFVLEDASREQSSTDEWAKTIVNMYHKWDALQVVAEVNFGGELIPNLIKNVDDSVPCQSVRAIYDKHHRADQVSLLYQQGKVKHAGMFPKLEDEMCTWVKKARWSPDRMDAMVWAITNLSTRSRQWLIY